jgi:hypothetical protein
MRIAPLLAIGLAACSTTAAKAKELERVAKDWCLTIRASQVMPVYPLTRDIWPGDVFLTTTPIGQEAELFESKGFLPLDIHLKRLGIADAIKEYYKTHLGEGPAFPGSVDKWADLPSSAFPTYSFSVSRSGGLNLAIPVQGVPVAFDYLQTSAATGTVSLQDSYTVGLDMATLQPFVEAWEKDNHALLAAYATDPEDKHATPVFVRIVARIYLCKRVTVNLADSASRGGELGAGIELPRPEPGTPDASKSATELYNDLAGKLNASLAAAPGAGGKVRILSASQRSVTMEETFTAPITIGFIAYDCRILPGGVLSMPVPSYQHLTGSPIAGSAVWNSAALVQAWYTADEVPRVAEIKGWMAQHLQAPVPTPVEFLSLPQWDANRRRMIRDLGMIPH